MEEMIPITNKNGFMCNHYIDKLVQTKEHSACLKKTMNERNADSNKFYFRDIDIEFLPQQ